ncbi:L-glutamine:2-deoxy-scyllo-inosose aminotransferase [compost metagenome]
MQPHDVWPPHELLSEMAHASFDYLNKRQDISIKDGSGIIAQFEDCLIQYYGVQHALVLNSGTSAVYSALYSVGIQEDDEVICQTSTFHASITPLLQCGGIPVLCETDGVTGNIDIQDLNRKITNKTKAIILTHMWGYPADMDLIMEIAEHNNLYVIEDCSHAHGTIYKGKKVGTIGHIGVFSMQGSKLVPAGEGGYLITSNTNLYERAMLLSQFGERLRVQIKNPDIHKLWETGLGLKNRIHPLSAVCAITAFNRFENYLERRRRRIRSFHEFIKDIPALNHIIEESSDDRYSYFMNRIHYNSELNFGIPINTVVKELRLYGLDIRISSHKPLYCLPLFKEKISAIKSNNYTRWPTYNQTQFPKTTRYFESLLGVPCFDHPDGDKLVEDYGRIIHSYFQLR